MVNIVLNLSTRKCYGMLMSPQIFSPFLLTMSVMGHAIYYCLMKQICVFFFAQDIGEQLE